MRSLGTPKLNIIIPLIDSAVNTINVHSLLSYGIHMHIIPFLFRDIRHLPEGEKSSLAVAWGIKKNQNWNCSEPSPHYEPDQELFETEVRKCLNVPVVCDEPT